MADWKPDLYLTFRNERTQPSIDLVNRIDHQDPKTIIDIGCGPGNSTTVLQKRWPHAQIIGLDNSEAMINKARSHYPEISWILKDASDDLSELGTFDIVFSNAAFHWMPDQQQLLQKLFGMLNKNGILAAQVPNTKQLPFRQEITKLVLSERWQARFADMADPFFMHSADYYYDILCNLTDELDIWETDYYHVMNSHQDIVSWTSGTSLRPYLDHLNSSSETAEFSEDYRLLLMDVYPLQPNGKILFPFTRVFFVAKNR